MRIRGVEFAKIIEAVTVHSYKIYDGKNDVAKVLQDADKMSGIGLGILGITKYFGGRDYVNSEEILRIWKDRKKMRKLSDYALQRIDDEDMVRTVMSGIEYLLEWKKTIHTESAKSLIRGDFEYLIRCRDFLTRKFNLLATSF